MIEEFDVVGKSDDQKHHHQDSALLETCTVVGTANPSTISDEHVARNSEGIEPSTGAKKEDEDDDGSPKSTLTKALEKQIDSEMDMENLFGPSADDGGSIEDGEDS